MSQKHKNITDINLSLLALGLLIATLGLILGVLEAVSLKDSLRILLAGGWVAAGAAVTQAMAARKIKATERQRGARNQRQQ